jgi:hypothetical protein
MVLHGGCFEVAAIARKGRLGLADVLPSPQAPSGWPVGDVDQAIPHAYEDHIDTLNCGQTGNRRWQHCGQWLSDG